MRSNYWTIGKFADWLRGTPSPGAETSKGWRDWEKTAQEKHPVRYWLAESGLRYLQDFVMWPIDKLHNIKYYINNRWVTRTHALTAHTRDIPRGEWRDVGNRFLPCLFNELVDFVEVELAWFHIAWDTEARKKFKSPWWATGWWRWRTWRSREAGLASLEWQRNLRWEEDEVSNLDNVGKLTPQAIAAQEIYDLYMWWTEEYPKRPDPMDASGWSEYCEKRWEKDHSIWDDLDDNEQRRATTGPMLNRMHEIEAQYDQEDEEMMVRLIRIRNSLWT